MHFTIIRNRVLAFLLLVCSVQLSFGQEIEVKAQLGRDTILIGDQIQLLLMADQPKNMVIDFPEVADTLGAIEVLERSAIDTINVKDDQLTLRQEFVITCFDSGPQPLPDLFFKLKYDELTDSVSAGALQVVVLSPKVDLEKGPADIKKPFAAPITLKEVAPWISGIILIGALIFLIVYAIRRRQQNLPLFQRPPKPREPAHVIALRALDKVKDEKLWQNEHVKEYYSQVTDVIRRYIEDRFEISAMERTSDQLLDSFKERKKLIDGKTFAGLESILQLSDFVKFAKMKPSEDDNQMTLANAYFFIQSTKIEEEKELVEVEDDREGEEVIIDMSNPKGGRKS